MKKRGRGHRCGKDSGSGAGTCARIRNETLRGIMLWPEGSFWILLFWICAVSPQWRCGKEGGRVAEVGTRTCAQKKGVCLIQSRRVFVINAPRQRNVLHTWIIPVILKHLCSEFRYRIAFIINTHSNEIVAVCRRMDGRRCITGRGKGMGRWWRSFWRRARTRRRRIR